MPIAWTTLSDAEVAALTYSLEEYENSVTDDDNDPMKESFVDTVTELLDEARAEYERRRLDFSRFEEE